MASLRKGGKVHNTTLDTTDRKDAYLRTFLVFASKEFFRESEPELEDDTRASFPRCHSKFDGGASEFTLLDRIAKPVEYIEVVISIGRKCSHPLSPTSKARSLKSTC
jgi:hypothetical protein